MSDRYRDVEQDWTEFWAPIVCKDGVPDMDLIKAELSDYRMAIEEVSKVYDEITGVFSKPNTRAEAVIDAVNENYRKIYNGTSGASIPYIRALQECEEFLEKWPTAALDKALALAAMTQGRVVQ